jgi:hypothetical protein
VLTTLERHNDANACGSSRDAWVTPSASLAEAGHRSRSGDRRNELLLTGQALQEWPTPTAQSYGSSNNGCPHDGREAFATKGKPSLERMANWPTPRAEDCEQTGAHRGAPDTLTSATRLWPTATANDAKASGSRTTAQSSAHAGISLTDVAVHGMSIKDTAMRREWITPTARDWKDSANQATCDQTQPHSNLLPRQVFDGQQDRASRNTNGKPPAPSRMLNADWVFQLMGYPREWARLSTKRGSRRQATQSCRRSRRSSGE